MTFMSERIDQCGPDCSHHHRAAPAGTGSPTPADDRPDTIDGQLRRLGSPTRRRNDTVTPAASADAEDVNRLAQELRDLADQRDLPPIALLAASGWLRDLVRERDAARAELSQVQKERDALAGQVEHWTAKRDELWTAWTRLASDLRQRGLPGLTDNPAEISRRVCQWVETLIQQGVDQANVIQRYSRERDEARSALAALRAEVGKIADALAADAVDVLENGTTEAITLGATAGALRALVTDQSPAAPEPDGPCAEWSALAARLRRERDAAKAGLEQVCAAVEEAADSCYDPNLTKDDIDRLLRQALLSGYPQRFVVDQSPAAPPVDLPVLEPNSTVRLSGDDRLWRVAYREDYLTLLGSPFVELRLIPASRPAALSPTSDTQTDGGGS